MKNALYKCLQTVACLVEFKRPTFYSPIKHLKKSDAACFYTPIALKLLIVVQM